MSKSKIFIGISVSFASGIWLGSKFALRHDFIFIVLGICAAIFAFGAIYKYKFSAYAALFLFCAGLGILRSQSAQVSNQYQNIFGTKQKLEGYIVEDTDIRQNNQLLTFQPKDFSQRVLITTTKTQEFFYGDWVVAEGKVAEPKEFSDFDYPKYLERFNVYALMKYPKVLILKNHQQNFIKENLLKIKHSFTGRVASLLSEPKSSLLLGILIGARKTLPQAIVDNFNSTGVSHIIAISGYNISIIISSLSVLARFFGRRGSFWLSLLVIVSFVMIAGLSASVIRAAIMGLMLLVAFYIGRQYSIAPALFFAGFVMLAINPKILFWDIGFQLSFAATLGIVYFMPLVEDLTKNWPNPLSIKDVFFTTMSAIVATLPLILLYFGRLSLTAPLVNILILPIIPTVMLLGFLGILPVIGAGFAFVAGILLGYILKITSVFASWNYTSLNVSISGWIFLSLTAGVFVLYSILKKLQNREVGAVEQSNGI